MAWFSRHHKDIQLSVLDQVYTLDKEGKLDREPTPAVAEIFRRLGNAYEKPEAKPEAKKPAPAPVKKPEAKKPAPAPVKKPEAKKPAPAKKTRRRGTTKTRKKNG